MIEFLTFLGVWILVIGRIIDWFSGETGKGKISLQIHHEFSEAFRSWAKTAEDKKASPSMSPSGPVNRTNAELLDDHRG